jgi:hypothetical protein
MATGSRIPPPTAPGRRGALRCSAHQSGAREVSRRGVVPERRFRIYATDEFLESVDTPHPDGDDGSEPARPRHVRRPRARRAARPAGLAVGLSLACVAASLLVSAYLAMRPRARGRMLAPLPRRAERGSARPKSSERRRVTARGHSQRERVSALPQDEPAGERGREQRRRAPVAAVGMDTRLDRALRAARALEETRPQRRAEFRFEAAGS